MRVKSGKIFLSALVNWNEITLLYSIDNLIVPCEPLDILRFAFEGVAGDERKRHYKALIACIKPFLRLAESTFLYVLINRWAALLHHLL